MAVWTVFPDGEPAAATWDPTLIQQEGTAKGAEFALQAAPTSRSARQPTWCAYPRWGRTAETYGEDPYLASTRSPPWPRSRACGEPGRDVDGKTWVAEADQECSAPNGGDNETGSQKSLEELYLSPFQSAIEQSAPASFMCSYAVVNSAPSCANADMLSSGLDTQANSGGFVVSDWGAAGNAVADLEGGMDIAMPFSNASSCAGRPRRQAP